MVGGESFISIFRQVFKLSIIEELKYTKEDIEDMPPYERYTYFELIDEFREELENKKKELTQQQKQQIEKY